MPVIHCHPSSLSLPGRRGVSIVEADQARTAAVMQGETVAKPMRPLRRRLHPFDDKPHDVVAACTGSEGVAIEVQQDIEGWIIFINDRVITLR